MPEICQALDRVQAAAGDDWAAAREAALLRVLPLAAAAGLGEAEALAARRLVQPRHTEWPVGFEVALETALECSGLGPASDLWPAGSLERDDEPPADADPRGPEFLFWVHWTFQQVESQIRCDGFFNVYAWVPPGRAAAIARAYAAVADPLRTPAAAWAASLVEEHGVPDPICEGAVTLAEEHLERIGKEDDRWRWKRGRLDLDAETRATLLLLRNADRIGGRRVAWVPEGPLPGEDNAEAVFAPAAG